MKFFLATILIMTTGFVNGQQTVALTPLQDASICYHDGYTSADKNYGALNFGGVSCQKGWAPWGIISARTFLDFDLSRIPHDAELTAATLLLFNYDAGSDIRYQTKAENRMVVERLASQWDEATITWNTQPVTYDEISVVTVSDVAMNDNAAVNVLPLVQDALNRGEQKIGLSLRLLAEQPVRGFFFYTREYQDSSKHPMLMIAYDHRTGLEDNAAGTILAYMIPNPLSHQAVLNLSSAHPVSGVLSLSDVNGRVVKSMVVNNQNQIILEREGFSSGMYFYELQTQSGGVARGKVVVQ